MTDIIIVVIIVSALFGIKNPLWGGISGAIVSVFLYYIFKTFNFTEFLLYFVLGFLVGYCSALIASWAFSGFKGGRGKVVPGVSYKGGFGGRGHPGGIISNEDDFFGPEDLKKKNEIRFFQILRWAIVPLLALLVIILSIIFLSR